MRVIWEFYFQLGLSPISSAQLEDISWDILQERIQVPRKLFCTLKTSFIPSRLRFQAFVPAVSEQKFSGKDFWGDFELLLGLVKTQNEVD